MKMDKKKTNLMRMYSQPTKKVSLNKLSSNKVSCSQNPIKLKNNNDTNITNFYQQKKRVLLNNDSFEDGNSRSPFKKQRKTDDIDSTPIISWDKANSIQDLNIDCQLNVEPSVESIQKDQNNLKLNNTKNEVKIDQMLNEFHAKLQFNCMSKIDSGRNSDFNDDTLDSDLTLSNAPDELKKIENLLMQQNKNYSKESGISSCNSINQDINSPIIIDKEKDKFKIPKTPNIKTKTIDKSIQFFSTPKLIAKQNKKLNQTLNFKDISPIKGSSNDNILININSDNKRQFNDSINEEDDLSTKKRNGKILFQNNKLNNKNKNENDFEDDSFDLVFSQALSKINDNELLNSKSTLNNQLNRPKQLNIQKNHFKSQPALNLIDKKNQKLKNSISRENNSQPTNLTNIKSSYSNNTKSTSSYSNNTKSILATKSSIQYSDDSSNLFVTTTNRKSLINQSNQAKEPKKDDLKDEMDDDELDSICSQVVVNI